MDLTERALKERLDQMPGGWSVRFYPAVVSTNETAHELGRDGAADHTVVIADSQSRGKGRLKRRWQSPPARNLYVSILLRPPVFAVEASAFPLAAGVAVMRVLSRYAGKEAVRLKWPNDVLIRGRKAAGILAEMRTKSGAIDWLVVGIGINVNMERCDFDPEIRETSVSLKEETGRSLSRLQLAADLLSSFEDCYTRFLREGFRLLREEWLASTDMIGRSVGVDCGEDMLTGIVETIGEDGALVLRDARGNVRRVTIGDATIRKNGQEKYGDGPARGVKTGRRTGSEKRIGEGVG